MSALPDWLVRVLERNRRAAEIVPQARLSGPIPWVIAIMVALMVIAAAGALALRNTARTAAAELSGGITVQIIEARPAERDRQARAALLALRQVPGVSNARIVPQEELDALIEPWLGSVSGAGDPVSGDAAAGIPVPALIDARFSGKLTAPWVAGLQQTLARAAPAAKVDAQATWLKPVFGAVTSLQLLALALIVLLAGTTAAAVLLSARTALGNNGETIEVVHLLGGTDAQIAAIFQRSIALDALKGGLAGFAAGIIVIGSLGKSFAALQAGIVTGAALSLTDWVLLGMVPLAAALLATLTARWTVMRALRHML